MGVMMALNFQSLHNGTIWIALLYGDTGCGATPFRKQGWWAVSPGQTRTLWNVPLYNVNRFAAFYAEEFKDSGGATWSGTGNGWYRIPDIAFNQCYDDNTNCNQQPNFVQLDFHHADNGDEAFYDLTVTLGPASGQMKTIGSVLIDDQA
jgi:Protein of unknown function (DUF1036)